MRKDTIANAIVALGIFCMLAKFGIYVVFIVALVATVKIVRGLR